MNARPSAASAYTRPRRSRPAAIANPSLNPSWLLDPPQGNLPAPPVAARAQLLPFGELPWQDFERLCLRLAKTEGKPDHWQLFGDAGEEQGGIDIFVRHPDSNRYVVWQAKRHKTFSATKLKAAVELFLDGEWSDQTERFVLATGVALRSAPLARAVEEAARVLAARGITFVPMDSERLSDRLKDHPEIVDDFFDRVWVERFCGPDAAAALGSRLGRRDYAQLRTRLADVYASHFASIDPGVVRAIGIATAPPTPLPLGVRFVPPDLYAPLDPTRPRAEGEARNSRDRESTRLGDATGSPPAFDSGGTDPAPRHRQALEAWTGTFERAIVIGVPGGGKSTLLRFLALDLFAAEPRLRPLRDRWPGYLSIWISFPFWTRQIASPNAGIASLEGAVSQWLQLQGEPDLIPLVGRALADGRVVLLVDGVDEGFDETAAGTALTLLSNLVDRRRCPVVVTSRPYGERVLQNLDATWKRRELASLTAKQQIEFATTCFEAGAEAATRATAMAQAFVTEIGSMQTSGVCSSYGRS
jgi:hypothetical protein